MTDMALTIPPPYERRRIGLKGFLVGLTVALLLSWTAVPLFMAVVVAGDRMTRGRRRPCCLRAFRWRSGNMSSPSPRSARRWRPAYPGAGGDDLSFILSLPTAYAIGRLSFPGKEARGSPIRLADRVAGHGHRHVPEPHLPDLRARADRRPMLGHAASMPMLRILATFEAIPQDIIDAAKNLGAGRLELVRHVLVPMVLPGLMAVGVHLHHRVWKSSTSPS